MNIEELKRLAHENGRSKIKEPDPCCVINVDIKDGQVDVDEDEFDPEDDETNFSNAVSMLQDASDMLANYTSNSAIIMPSKEKKAAQDLALEIQAFLWLLEENSKD